MTTKKIIKRCNLDHCKRYGEELVDRRYGYPVCPSCGTSLQPLAMNKKFEGQYNTEEEGL